MCASVCVFVCVCNRLCVCVCVCRQGGDLPQGVIPHPNGTLEFGRPLSAGDGGVYQCVVRNVVDSSKATVELKVAGRLLALLLALF